MADRRNLPIIPKDRTVRHANYLLNFWFSFEYQTPQGELIDNPEPDEESDGRTDLESDLGFGGQPSFNLGGQVNHKNPFLPDFRFDFTRIKFRGSQVLDRNLTMAGVTFRDGQQVDTTLTASTFDMTLVYHPVHVGSFHQPKFVLGLGVTLRLTDAHIYARGLGTWRVGSEKYDVPVIPLGYLMMDIYPYRYIGLHTVVRGISDGTSRWIDGLAELRTSPISQKSWIGAGVRYQDLNVQQPDRSGMNAQILAYVAGVGIRY